jgi:hypothetical protein
MYLWLLCGIWILKWEFIFRNELLHDIMQKLSRCI